MADTQFCGTFFCKDGSMNSNENFEFLVNMGLKDAQKHYKRQHISISDAVNLFHAKTTQTDALPILFLIKCLFEKYGKDFEMTLMDSYTTVTQDVSKVCGITNKWMDKLVEKFNSLPA